MSTTLVSPPGLTPGWPAVTLAEADAILTRAGASYEISTAVVNGRRMRVWRNAPATLRDPFIQARSFGDAEFMILDDERVTYEAFARATLSLALQLARDGVLHAMV